LLWGRDYSANQFLWLTDDPDPDNWPVIVFLRYVAPTEWLRFDGSMSQFLLAVWDGSWEFSEVLPETPAEGHTWTLDSDWLNNYQRIATGLDSTRHS
jgi:hypothetical protein